MRFALLVVVVLVACTKRNPNVCCETDAECAAVGYDSPQPCDVGVCVANTCADTGCDGNEDCLDPATPVCESGACVSGISACEAAGGRIAFVSNRDGDDDIYVALADGDDPRLVTITSAFEGGPRWSPDGTRLAFTQRGEVHVIDPDTQSENAVTTGMSASNLRWSPDGSRIAFQSGQRAYAMAVSGADLRPLEGLDAIQSGLPSWSADGTKLAIRSRTQTSNDQLWLVGADGAQNESVMLQEVAGTIDAVEWSPDGSQIAVIITGSNLLSDLWIFSFAGQNLLNVTMSPANELEVSWAPTSDHVAVVRDFGGELDVWVLTTGGWVSTNVTSSTGVDAKPSWSPDGSHLIFESSRSGPLHVYRVAADGAGLQDLAAGGQAVWARCLGT